MAEIKKCYVLVDKRGNIVASDITRSRIEISRELRQGVQGDLKIKTIKKKKIPKEQFFALLDADTDLVHSFGDIMIMTSHEENEMLDFLTEFETNLFESIPQVVQILSVLRWDDEEIPFMETFHEQLQSLLYTIEMGSESSFHQESAYDYVDIEKLYPVFLKELMLRQQQKQSE